MTSLDLHQTKSGRFEQFGVLADDFYGEGDLVDGALTAGLGLIPKFQVFRAIVRSLTILVMDIFIASKTAANHLLHDHSVFEDLLSAPPKGAIAMHINIPGPVAWLMQWRGGTGGSVAGHSGSVHTAIKLIVLWLVAAINRAVSDDRNSALGDQRGPGISVSQESAIMPVTMTGFSYSTVWAAVYNTGAVVFHRRNHKVRASRAPKSAQVHGTIPPLLRVLFAPIHLAYRLACAAVLLLVDGCLEMPLATAAFFEYAEIRGSSPFHSSEMHPAIAKNGSGLVFASLDGALKSTFVTGFLARRQRNVLFFANRTFLRIFRWVPHISAPDLFVCSRVCGTFVQVNKNSALICANGA